MSSLRELHRSRQDGRSLLDLEIGASAPFCAGLGARADCAAAAVGRTRLRLDPSGPPGREDRLDAVLPRLGTQGRLPADPQRSGARQHARTLFADAQATLDEIIAAELLTARAVIGLFPANSHGDDVLFYADESRSEVAASFRMLRQQTDRGQSRPCYSLADFVAPAGSGVDDYAGVFAVTAGIGTDALVRRYEQAHDDYNAIMVKALADRLAEALAEWMHEEVRRQYWGYAPDETLSNEDLIAEKYRGIRPAPGYPACPDHSEKRTLFELLNVEAAIDMHLTENCAMTPLASVSGYYFAHPEAAYFSVGHVDRDQVEDYAARKGMTPAEVERWLRPNLAYDSTG